MSTRDEDVLLMSASYVVIKLLARKRGRKNRRLERTLGNGDRYGIDSSSGLRTEYRGGFMHFCRMSLTDFESLVALLGPKISKSDTNYRKSIPVHERLAVTLRFLATGESYTCLKYRFKISKQIISRIIPEVCGVLISRLRELIQMPGTPEQWHRAAQSYNTIWNFPQCVGTVDGRYIFLRAPIGGGQENFYHEGISIIILLAAVDATYRFIYADIECEEKIFPGERISNELLFKQSRFYRELKDGAMNLPPESVLPGRQKPVPYVFVSDGAFSLEENIMKAYSVDLARGLRETIFNYRLSTARKAVDTALGFVSAVFRVLRRPLLLRADTAKVVVLACVYLHNFLMKSESSRNLYTPPGSFDFENDADGELVEGAWRKRVKRLNSFVPLSKIADCRLTGFEEDRLCSRAQEIRNEFADYFCTTGAVVW